MRSSLILLFVILSGILVSELAASEAGLTAGTPVLSAAELKELAPEPLPVVADPATSVRVTPKAVAQAEELAAAEAKAPVKKAAPKKDAKDAKKGDAKSKDKKSDKTKVASRADAKAKDKKSDAKSKDKKADPKLAAKSKDKKSDTKAKDKKADAKSKDKKADPKLAAKTDAKSKDKKSDKAKVAAKPESKSKDKKDKAKAKTDVKVAAKPESKSKDKAKAKTDAKVAAKPAAKSKDKKSDQAKKDQAPKLAGKPVKSSGKLAFGPVNGKKKAPEAVEADDAETTEVASTDDEASVGGDDEEELVPAKPSKKSTTVADKKAKGAAKIGAPKALPVDEETEEEVADAPAKPAKAAPAADPSVLSPEDEAKFKTTVATWLRSIATLETGGSADVKLSGIHLGKVQGRDAVQFDGARLVVNQVKLQTTHVKKATIELKNLALDAAGLKAGSCALVGTPTVVPDLTLEHAQVQAQLGKNNIKNPNIAYEAGQMVFTGKAPFMFFSIPFRMAGKLERNGNNIAFRIADLQIKGSAAGADRRASVQAKLDHMIKLENVLAPIGAPGAPVRGGKVNIEDGATVVFSAMVDGAVPAE